ncbi:hypothetical protein [Nonlabens sp. Asnod2-A12]|uniref:hypothetical protein n=1 Tax=Nonlabens sp. Asnod2-A12 TaxID=3160578 RepID=UPI00386E8DF1
MFRKSYLYYLFFTVIVLISISSCEKDEIVDVQHGELDPKISGRPVSINELLSQKNLRDKISNITSRSITKSSVNNIKLDTTLIKMIQVDSITHYTFKILPQESDSTSVLKNYILSVVNDSTFIQIIAEYPRLGTDDYDKSNVSMTQVFGDDLIPSFVKCGMTLTLLPALDCYTWSCGGSTGDGTHENGDSECKAKGSDRAGYNCVTSWTFVRGSSPCDNGGGAISGGGGGGGRIYIPIDPVEDELSEIESFYNSITTYLNTFIQSDAQLDLKQELELYLEQENYSTAAQSFAEQVIKAKWEDPNAEIDYQFKSIEDSDIPDCLKVIIDKFKPDGNGISVDVTGLTTGLYTELNLAGDVLELFDNDGNYGLRFSVGDLDPYRTGRVPNAHTESGPTNLGGRMSVITFDQNYVNNATDLALARTVIHELVHAYIKYQLVNQPGGDMGRAIDELFGQIYIGNAPGDPQHVLMANAFVDAMANSLEQWHNDPNVASIEYTRMAWSGGMRDSDAYEALDFTEQNLIISRDAVESRELPPSLEVPLLGIIPTNC